MATSVLKKKTVTEAKISSDRIKEKQAVRRKVKKVTFCPEAENEVFEFTPSVKKPRRKNVRSRSQEGPAQDIQQGGTELRRSKRLVANAITGRSIVIEKARNVPRRSRRIGFSGRGIQEKRNLMAQEQFEANKDISRRSTRLAVKSCMGSGTSKEEPLLPAKRFKRLVDIGNKEGPELTKYITNELCKESEVLETRKHRKKDVLLGPKAEKVSMRCRGFGNEMTNTHLRRSIRLKAIAANPFMGGGTSDGEDLCFGKESKEERNTIQSRESVAVNIVKKLVKDITKEPEPLIDCDVQTTGKHRRMKVQNVSIVEKVPRRSERRRRSPIPFWRSSSAVEVLN